jgi:hypothetical protein
MRMNFGRVKLGIVDLNFVVGSLDESFVSLGLSL